MDDETGHSGQSVQADAAHRADYVRRSARRPGFDGIAVAAIHSIKEDLGRQLELASDRQNAMVQSVGIILAFASILLVETVRSLYLDNGDALGVISLASFLLCSVVGIVTIWQWRGWDLYAGFEYGKIADLFDDRKFVDLERLLLRGVAMSHSVAIGNNYVIRGRIKYMVMSFFIGVASMLIGTVIL